ncbi:hypothetical protein OIU14_04580 [Thalassobacter stenotrophicus]|nr:hypothetical protein [Thalassobacter stenotrophicus]UYP69015.1 hypothetical protein OIU14_04580 [Thalassobacter stenotrophicus]
MSQRYRHLMAHDKPKMTIATAIARKMVGFIWATARLVTSPIDASVRAQD